MWLAVSIAVFACLALAVSAQAAKPKITVDMLGRSLRVTFVAPATTTMHLRYFVRAETPRQEGCSWKSTVGGRGGRAGQTVIINLSPNSRQGGVFCPGAFRVTVFMQRAQSGLIARDATPATFRLVGRVSYQVGP
jgi:hypothetical protein